MDNLNLYNLPLDRKREILNPEEKGRLGSLITLAGEETDNPREMKLLKNISNINAGARILEDLTGGEVSGIPRKVIAPTSVETPAVPVFTEDRLPPRRGFSPTPVAVVHEENLMPKPVAEVKVTPEMIIPETIFSNPEVLGHKIEAGESILSILQKVFEGNV